MTQESNESVEPKQGVNLSTMDVSTARIGKTAITLEEHQAGISAIQPEADKVKPLGIKSGHWSGPSKNLDPADPRLPENRRRFKPAEHQRPNSHIW